MSETRHTGLPSPRELKALIDAERTGSAFVHWRDGAGEQHILMLDAAAARVRVGRREGSDIALTWDAEVYLSVDAVKSQLRILFDRFGLGDLPQNEKRSRLVALVLASGVLVPHDF